VQRLVRDQRQDFLEPLDLTAYVNKARRDIAGQTKCLRIVPPITGQIINYSIVNAGSGYHAGSVTVSITGPDFPSGRSPFPLGDQATASASINNGTISQIVGIYGGAGYFQPQVSIVGPGANASVTPIMSRMNTLVQGQEAYPFANIDLSQFPGYGGVNEVLSVQVIYANYRYTIPKYAWTIYQSYIRQYPFQYQYVPTFCSQLEQGASGVLYFYPFPSQTFQMEWDCICFPQDLTTNLSVEAIPTTWQDAIPFYAAYLAYLELQNFNSARAMLEQYDRHVTRYSGFARSGAIVNPYGRY